MVLGDNKAITENIEMELFSSEEPCEVITMQQQEEEEHSFHQRYLEHPLVPDCEKDPELQGQTEPRQSAKPKTKPPVWGEPKHRLPVLGFTEKTEIEMEVFPPIKVSESERVERKPRDHIYMYYSGMWCLDFQPPSNKASRLKWKKPIPQKTGLVVKDVVCLPRGHCMSQLESDSQESGVQTLSIPGVHKEDISPSLCQTNICQQLLLSLQDRHTVPQSKERAALAAMGMTARITVNYSWSASQIESRLASLFRGQFVKQAGQRFSFTYLQCVQGSRVLFVPDTPADGWTGEQVLRICEHDDLYILSRHAYPQAQSERSASERLAVNRKASADADSQLVRQVQPHVRKTPEELNLDTILRQFRQENLDRDVQSHIQVKRGNLLHGALKATRRPGFYFGTTPIISFSGEETNGHEGPLREFFRLTLLELQQTRVFEGRPGRLFFTCDLTALEDRKYYEAGVLIGWSLAQGGPGPRCLHPALYQLMCRQSLSLEDFSWRDIVDAEAQTRLQELHSCTDVKLLSPSLCDWVSCCGITGISSARSEEIPAIYTRLVKHYIYHRVAGMISQFTKGLNSCGGLWDVVQSHWQAFMPVMTRTQQQVLTLEEFKQLFTVCYSRPDSQLRAAEEATVGHWETVLGLLGDGKADFSFEDLLAFITGADHLPPLGFPRLISLCFYSQDASTSNVRLPHASTCALELFLPRGVAEAADLLALLSRAVHGALGFAHFQTKGDGEDSCTEVMA